MKILIFLIIVFIVIVYLFSYIRYKKLRRKKIDTVQSFHDTYDNVYHATDKQKQPANIGCVDFIDKEDFISDIQAEIKESNHSTGKPTVSKKLKF